MVKYLSFHNKSSFALRKILFNVNGKAIVCDTPLVLLFIVAHFESKIDC